MSTTITFEELKENLTFKSDLMLDNEFVLLPVTVSITPELIKALKEWNFTEFQCESGISLGGDIGVEAKPKEDSETKTATPTVTDSVKTALENIKSETVEDSDRTRLESVQEVYQEYMKYINSVYTHYATHKKISLDEMTETVKDLCIFIRENKRYVLRISPSAEARNKNFLVIHSMRSTVLAITIGLELHLALSKLIELGITCILHEIGMLRLPPQLYMTDKPLSVAEKAQISMHPLFSCNILKEQNFPLSIQLGVLEHHEKENGQGYPRHLSGEKISTYAKIISVACSFEAITAPRAYKTERTTFDAMVEMLKNPNNQYDVTVIKALLYNLSLYPIGAYVYLNNGKIGLVTDVTPNNPKNPMVQLINEKDSDGSPKTIQTDDGSNKIIRVLSKEEQADVIKSIQLQTEAEKEREKQKKQKIAQENSLGNEYMNGLKKEREAENGFSSVDLSAFD